MKSFAASRRKMRLRTPTRGASRCAGSGLLLLLVVLLLLLLLLLLLRCESSFQGERGRRRGRGERFSPNRRKSWLHPYGFHANRTL
jgi:hypothetical protein